MRRSLDWGPVDAHELIEPDHQCCPTCAAASVEATRGYLSDAIEVLEDVLRAHRQMQEVIARSASLLELASRAGLPAAPGADLPPIAIATAAPVGAGRRRTRRSAETTGARSDRVLTERELEVLVQVTRGHTNRQIARQLGISEKTVKNHLSAVFEKVGASDRTQAALYAIRVGLVPA